MFSLSRPVDALDQVTPASCDRQTPSSVDEMNRDPAVRENRCLLPFKRQVPEGVDYLSARLLIGPDQCCPESVELFLEVVLLGVVGVAVLVESPKVVPYLVRAQFLLGFRGNVDERLPVPLFFVIFRRYDCHAHG